MVGIVLAIIGAVLFKVGGTFVLNGYDDKDVLAGVALILCGSVLMLGALWSVS